MIYTIGHEKSYRESAEKYGTVWKLGKMENPDRDDDFPYPGGYAFLTAEDAQRRIDEAGYEGFIVMGLDADWEEDTEPSEAGWWHHLLADAPVIFLDEEKSSIAARGGRSLISAYLRHLWSLLRHKWFVFVSGLRLGGIPIWRLLLHDWVKFLPAEFVPYARNFHLEGNKADDGGMGFALAWLHHENRQDHHWGYWIPASGRYAGKPLPMPEVCCREMVADWMGAGRAYTGDWDMADWLTNNYWSLDLHMSTRATVNGILIDDLGYGYDPEKKAWEKNL